MLGDSITEGQFSGPIGQSWAQILQSKNCAGLLGKNSLKQRPIEIHNVGLGGTTSLDWSLSYPATWSAPYNSTGSMFQLRAQPHLPTDIVLLMLGTNDAVGFGKSAPTTPNEFEFYMREIVTNLLNLGVKKIILMNPPKRFYDGPAVDARLKSYKLALDRIDNDFANVEMGPDFYNLLDTTHFEGMDVHPNQKGYREMARHILKKLNEVLDIEF